MSALRVLLVVENLPVPTDRRVWSEARSLTAAGYEVTVVCPKGRERDIADVEVREGVAIHRFESAAASGSAISYLREYVVAALRICVMARRLSRERPFDVIHVANPPDVLVPWIRLTCARGASVVYDQHDAFPELFLTRFGGHRRLLLRAVRAFEQLSYRLSSVVVVTNESFRSLAESRGGRSRSDVFVVRNAPDLRRFEARDPDLALRRGKKHLIAYAGVMGPQDGVSRALEALAQLGDRRSDWHAAFAGDGDCLEELRGQARELGLENRVDFLGWLSSPQLAQLLATADVCIAPEPPSPINDISTLVKIAEYMAAGKPVVCQDLPESRVTAGDAAIYANDGPASYAEALDALLEDAELRRALGEAARLRVARSFTWERSERELLAAYERVVARRGGLVSRRSHRARVGLRAWAERLGRE